MDIETIREYALQKPGKISEEFPFDEETLVFKIEGKIFLLTGLGSLPFALNLKCDPERAIELRDRYDSIRPGFHMNKKYWNTVIIDGRLPDALILELIDHSYNEVIKNLPKKKITKRKRKIGR